MVVHDVAKMAGDAVAVVATMLRSAAPSVAGMGDVAVIAAGRDACDAPELDVAATLLLERGVAEGEIVAFVDAAARWVGPTGGAGAAALLSMLGASDG